MPDYSDYETNIRLLEEAQDVEQDSRRLSKEDHEFITLENGQWESDVFENFSDKPRYTFDQTTPIVDQISGDMEKANFDIEISPTGNGATKELADLRSGMTRNIENISEAQGIYAMAGRNMTTSGIDHWMVDTEFLDESSFDQDLVIKPIHNSIDRVWFDVGAQRQDKADSDHGWLLSAIPREQFIEKNEDRAGISVSQANDSQTFFNKADSVVIGHLYFRKLKDRELIKTTLGRVFFEDDEAFVKVQDELAKAGETIEDRRTVKTSTFFMRKFDGEGWIGDAQETVFKSIPLVPIYGNYQVLENKTLYRGVVRKLKDPQRVFNYSQSREIEEGALAPREKTWMTKAQAKGHTRTLATLNTNIDPVQYYNHEEGQLPPFNLGGAKINPGLRILSDGMRGLMGSTAGMFAAGMGDNPGLQSGVAIERLQNKTNNISVKYFAAVEVGVCRTATIINEAYPIVYDSQRQKRIMNIDGSFEMKEINEGVIDEQTGENVILNDMSIGKYTATCRAGPSFASQQDENVQSILKVAAVNPSILDFGSDIFLSNAGLGKMAERARIPLLNAGVIPEGQMTDEEKQEAILAAQQPPEQSADMVLAQGELMKGQAALQKNELQFQKDQNDAVFKQQQAQNTLIVKAQELQLKAQKLQLEGQKQDLAISEKLAGFDRDTQQQEFEQVMALRDEQRQIVNDDVDNLNTQANTLKTLAEAISTSPIQGPGNVLTYVEQTREVAGAQANTQ